MGHVNIWNLTGPGGEWGARVVLCPNDVHGNVPDETIHLLSDKVQQLPIHPSEQHIDSNSQNTHKTPECVNCVCVGGGGVCASVYTQARAHTYMMNRCWRRKLGAPSLRLHSDPRTQYFTNLN